MVAGYQAESRATQGKGKNMRWNPDFFITKSHVVKLTAR